MRIYEGRQERILFDFMVRCAKICSRNEQMNEKPHILESEETLQIIKEIELNPQVTQRTLSQKLEISLGKINFLVNALIDKGVIEVKNFKNSKQKLAYMYLLTPEGIKVKIELLQKFIQWKVEEYAKLKKEIEFLKKEQEFTHKNPLGRNTND